MCVCMCGLTKEGQRDQSKTKKNYNLCTKNRSTLVHVNTLHAIGTEMYFRFVCLRLKHIKQTKQLVDIKSLVICV